MSSPTQRSLAKLREEGWHAEVVERWIPGANIRKDLFGVVDIVGLRGDQTIGVQTTSASNVAARIKKFTESQSLALLRAAHWTLVIHGWSKVKGRWVCREVDLS